MNSKKKPASLSLMSEQFLTGQHLYTSPIATEIGRIVTGISAGCISPIWMHPYLRPREHGGSVAQIFPKDQAIFTVQSLFCSLSFRVNANGPNDRDELPYLLRDDESQHHSRWLRHSPLRFATNDVHQQASHLQHEESPMPNSPCR